MNILLVLIPLALGLGGLGLGAFLWSLKSRQYSDLDGASWRALHDEADQLDIAAARAPHQPQAAPQPALGTGLPDRLRLHLRSR
jgi:cbb3-type cytochrome oxidase maturation protein